MNTREQRILIVEDQPELRTIFEAALSSAGYEVHTAFSAPQALRKIDRTHYDLILTDLAMPDMNGHELIERVRAHPEKGRTPIVAVTAHNWGPLAQEAVGAGCDGFIEKPVDAKQLRREVEKYLRGWRFKDSFSDGDG